MLAAAQPNGGQVRLLGKSSRRQLNRWTWDRRTDREEEPPWQLGVSPRPYHA
jgi:hypothetical protein